MSKQREALEMALDVLEANDTCDDSCQCSRKKAMQAIREALAEPEPEPVVKFLGRRITPEGTRECWGVLLCDFRQDPAIGTKLYTAPPARKPLTGDEISAIVQSMSAYTWDAHMFARAIERAHGIE